MQLSLFDDNRLGLLLNIADEFLLARDLDQAISVYDDLLAEYTWDRKVPILKKLVMEWRDFMDEIAGDLDNPATLHTIWLRRDTLTHPPLRTAILGILTDSLAALPRPEQVCLLPDFHLGHVLIETGRHEEAADCFKAALSGNNVAQGRFLAWHGDALTLAGNEDTARENYLAAFLDDPFTVDMQSVKNRTITELHNSLHFDAMDEIEEAEEAAWLPVWGWFQGIFALPLQPGANETHDSAELELRLTDPGSSLPRLWFDMLTHAERLRVMHRDDRELGAVRRLMKRTNGFMFGCYLEKIGGRR
jgi:tetratricopeptide (TPR) repeat protein